MNLCQYRQKGGKETKLVYVQKTVELHNVVKKASLNRYWDCSVIDE